MIEFEWNRVKDLANQKKHNVSFFEEKSVFFDEYAVQFYDEEHFEEEDRFIFSKMKSRKPPYASKLKKPVTIRMGEDVSSISKKWQRKLAFLTKV